MDKKIEIFFEAVESGDFNQAKDIFIQISERQHDIIIKRILSTYAEKGYPSEAINIVENILEGEEKERILEMISRIH